jgi:hypothetical protein
MSANVIYLFYMTNWLSPYSDKATTWTTGLWFPAETGNFSLRHRAHPTSYPVRIETLTPGVKRQGREADCSPSSSAELKKA